MYYALLWQRGILSWNTGRRSKESWRGFEFDVLCLVVAEWHPVFGQFGRLCGEEELKDV